SSRRSSLLPRCSRAPSCLFRFPRRPQNATVREETREGAMFKDGLFSGKRILVTGGGTGLGKAMSERFLTLGAEIFICGRRKQVCEATADELMKAHGGKIHAFGVDIRDAAAVDAMAEEIFSS